MLSFIQVPKEVLDSPCRGIIEGRPVCADTNWSLWKGFQGNGFCCAVGQTGFYDARGSVAGICVDDAAKGGYTSAVLVSPEEADNILVGG